MSTSGKSSVEVQVHVIYWLLLVRRLGNRRVFGPSAFSDYPCVNIFLEKHAKCGIFSFLSSLRRTTHAKVPLTTSSIEEAFPS